MFVFYTVLNPLTPNDPYRSRTAPLTSKHCILNIYSTNIGTEYFKHGIYSPLFSLQNTVCFIILTYLFPVLFTFYIQDVLKLKKNSGAKRLIRSDKVCFSPTPSCSGYEETPSKQSWPWSLTNVLCCHTVLWRNSPTVTVEVSRSDKIRHTHTAGRTPLNQWSHRRTGHYLHNTQQKQETDIRAVGGIRTLYPSYRAAADPRLIPRGKWDRPWSLSSPTFTLLTSQQKEFRQ